MRAANKDEERLWTSQVNILMDRGKRSPESARLNEPPADLLLSLESWYVRKRSKYKKGNETEQEQSH